MTDRQHDQVPTAQPRWSWGHHADHADHAAQPRWSWG